MLATVGARWKPGVRGMPAARTLTARELLEGPPRQPWVCRVRWRWIRAARLLPTPAARLRYLGGLLAPSPARVRQRFGLREDQPVLPHLLLYPWLSLRQAARRVRGRSESAWGRT